jgi:hypothetical protein
VATVDLPDAERPVNQMVKPRWERRLKRSERDREGCQVMLLYHKSYQQGEFVGGGKGYDDIAAIDWWGSGV